MLPDLVLLDYSLPDLLGDQVCQRLLQNETTARIPVVMMSGHISEMAAAARKYPNIVATIAKPFMSEALVALVTETLTKGPLAPSAPLRRGDGKKPAKKNGAGARKEVVEKQPVPAPPPPAAPPPARPEAPLPIPPAAVPRPQPPVTTTAREIAEIQPVPA